MKRKTILLSIALGFLTSALSAQAITPINALPCVINTSGTYVLTRNLTWVAGPQGAITITPQSGPIILDLKGHTITGPGNNQIGIFVGPSANTGSITIQNGTPTKLGVWRRGAGVGERLFIKYYVQKIAFTNVATECVTFQHVNSSTVSGCSFDGSTQYGILDANSQGGNRYTSNTFDGKQLFMLLVWD